MENESVPKIKINDTVNLFFKLQSTFSNIALRVYCAFVDFVIVLLFYPR